MALIKRVKTAYLFPNNGMLVTIDVNGQQIGELQGAYSIDTHKRILLEAMDNCEFNGFDILPFRFTKHAREWAELWRERNMSMEDIDNL